MSPVLWGLPTYFVMWGVATVVCIALGIALARVNDGSVARSLAVGIFLFGVILAGSKLLYLAESFWFPADDYVPERLRGHGHGFRIPGGILLLALTMPASCRLAKVSWPRFGENFVIVVSVMLVLVRLGCFLNGCCFGKVSTMPWAFEFPRDSWVHFYHVSQGWISPAASASLPVHPLQLYFCVAAVVSLALLLWLRYSGEGVGEAQYCFFALFFSSTAVLELVRANYLTLNNWLVVPAAAAALLALLSVITVSDGERAVPDHASQG